MRISAFLSPTDRLQYCRMISLSWFLIAWLVAMGVFGILTIITVALNLRYAPTGFVTYASTTIFLGVIAIIFFLLVMPYLPTVDWSQTMAFLP